MAVHFYSGRILLKSLVVSLAVVLVVSLALSLGAGGPAQAGHFLTHPAEAPSAAQAVTQTAAQRAAALFEKGAEIKIRKDAKLYITARNIPENDRLLAAYNAERPNGGQVQTQFGQASAVPGLLGIANQAHRAQDPDGRNAQAYSLADAMRDAIWRKQTAARLKSLTLAQSACASGGTRRTPSIGLLTSC
jgi:hypothetical protein